MNCQSRSHSCLVAFILSLPVLCPSAPSAPLPALPRHRVIPLPDHQASFLVDGTERLRWHFGPQYPRPFFYPLIGPAGSPLTRMGHPGAPNHDHHRSIWFAHADVGGIDFWSDQTRARIRQKQWLLYEDGEHEAIMGVLLAWNDADGTELIEQELIAALREAPGKELYLELQSTFRPGAKDPVELRQSNFGLLAIRMAKSISSYFGAGQLTNSDGITGEPGIFGRPSRWMDYSGPVPSLDAPSGIETNGITCFDHSSNPAYPARWHVREDGWMGPSLCRTNPVTITAARPLTVRYLLYAHKNRPSLEPLVRIAEAFNRTAPMKLIRSTRKHTSYEVIRLKNP